MVMNLNSIHVGIIGLGRMGHRHIEAANKMGMQVDALVDQSTSALSDAAKKFNIPDASCFTDVKAMLEKKKLDAVVIATTAPSHAEYTIMCAQNNIKYILCEKPMALSIDETNAMVDACSHYGAKLAINHCMMFLPQYTEIKKMILANDYGPLSSIIVSGSNFGLAMNASHYFEMFRFLTDSDIQNVQAWFEADKVVNPRGAQFEDYSGALLAKNANGLKMYIDFSVNAGHGLQVVYIFKYAQVIVDELSGFVRTICRKEEYKTLPTTRYGMPDDIHQLNIPPFEMIDSTIGVWKGMLMDTAYPDHRAGTHAMKCLVAAIESQENNHALIDTGALAIDKSRKFKWA